MVVLAVYVGLLGLILGSFLNVVVYRVPRGLSLSRPPSQCPVCGHPIRRRHNVPVAGWLILRGRCADCRARISVRYPLVELGTGVTFAALALRLHALDLLPALPAYLAFAAVGMVLVLIDLDGERLPNRLVMGGFAVIVILLAGASAWRHDWMSLLDAALGGGAFAAVVAVLGWAYPVVVKLDHAKLAGLAGIVTAYLSWGALVIGAAAAGGLAVAVGLLVMARPGQRSDTATTSRPSLIGGCLVAGALLAVLAR